MKAVLIGRHAPDMGKDIEIIEHRAITFPATATECEGVIEALIREAHEQHAALLFQALPAQVAVALAKVYQQHCWDDTYDAAQHHDLSPGPWPYEGGIGVIISRPGPRPGRVREVYAVPSGSFQTFEAAVKLANPRATVGFADYDEPDVAGNVGYSPDVQPVFVEVDGPPMPFVFSHIEWLS